MSSPMEERVSLEARRGGGGYMRPGAPHRDAVDSGYHSMQDKQLSPPRQRNATTPGEQETIPNGTIRKSSVGGSGRRSLENTKDLTIRDKPRNNSTSGGKSQRICQKCGIPLTGQFVRALGGTFHLDCFNCRDCGQVVASKFFPVDDENGEGQYPLCETDYFRRQNLLCYKCGGALRDSYVTALDRKYHIDHFTCSICPMAFGAKDSYYEHDGKVYCHYHYSTRFAQRCNGCQTAILKQFVEIFRNGQNQHWHPECYMIHKFWVKLSPTNCEIMEQPESIDDATEEQRRQVREEEEQMENRIWRIWSVLSSFEESSAACISDMLLHVSNGAYVDGVLVAKKFILHLEVLFRATDRLDDTVRSQGLKALSYGREAKILSKKIVAFFLLLSKQQEMGMKRLGVTQELLSLVTGLAHYLKLLIRISLQGALKLEREKRDSTGLHNFLDDLEHLESIKDADPTLDSAVSDSRLADDNSDKCSGCKEPIDDECFQIGDRRWHPNHFHCAHCDKDLSSEMEIHDAGWNESEQRLRCQRCIKDLGSHENIIIGGIRVTRLQSYIYLLRVALARLLELLRSSGTLPHTSDDPNLASYDSSDGHRIKEDGTPEPSLLGPNSRSKSYGGTSTEDQGTSSYEQTVGEMKRLRSTRMEKHLSTTMKRARTSRIIEGPEGQSLGNRAPSPGAEHKNDGFHIVEERDWTREPDSELNFHQDALTLDDIPRIVAAEQAKEQRPNAYKHAKNQLLGTGSQPKLIRGNERDLSRRQELDLGGEYPMQRQKKYFSELSALEYFIVRHIAVLQMQPLLEGHFNLEDLLCLIESRKPTFWGKFGRAFTKDKAKASKKKGVFGVALDVLVERDGVESSDGVGPGQLKVPSILDDTMSAMRQMDMSVEGVFRKNGNIMKLKDLARKIDMKEEEVDLTKEGPVQVAALLKRFLRELPDPLLTYKLHELFTTSPKIQDPEKRKRVLHLTCCLLPKTHRDSMEILFSFLNWAASFSQVDEESGSKMDSHNLATVIAPNILKHPDTDTKGPVMDESFLAIEAVNMLIMYNDQMCEVPDDIQSILNDNTLFNNPSDITTKEILKRYGEVVKSPARPVGPSQTSLDPDGNPMIDSLPRRETSGNARAGTSGFTRVDTDPSQARAWQKESSVRHVQGNGSPAYYASGPPSAQNLNQNTPPQMQFEQFEAPNPPYRERERTGSDDSGGSYGKMNGMRQGQQQMPPPQHQGSWSRQSSGVPPGPMGVTGA